MREERELEQRINILLEDPQWAGHPLREALADLHAEFSEVVHQLDRIMHISDRYQSVAREQSMSLHQRYRKQLRQLEKLARISDRYQLMMRDLNEALKDASQRDALTGLGNRRLLTERIKAEVGRAERTGRPLTVAMVDVDHFKEVNDAWGHEAGDQVLIEVARAISSGVREYDVCGRWGGEEFLVIMPEVGVNEGMGVVERIRNAVSSLDVRINDVPIALSASIGVAEHRPGASAAETVNRADAALLVAKRGGRNRCEVA